MIDFLIICLGAILGWEAGKYLFGRFLHKDEFPYKIQCTIEDCYYIIESNQPAVAINLMEDHTRRKHADTA